MVSYCVEGWGWNTGSETYGMCRDVFCDANYWHLKPAPGPLLCTSRVLTHRGFAMRCSSC